MGKSQSDFGSEMLAKGWGHQLSLMAILSGAGAADGIKRYRKTLPWQIIAS